jgi:hypothetical protein
MGIGGFKQSGVQVMAQRQTTPYALFLRLQLRQDIQLGDIVEHHERSEQNQHYERHLVHPLFELLI